MKKLVFVLICIVALSLILGCINPPEQIKSPDTNSQNLGAPIQPAEDSLQSTPTQQGQLPLQQPSETNGISVQRIGSTYAQVLTKPTGWFTTAQEADILLSGINFNDAGGPLLFNHPGTVATDGTHLVLAERNNNRVLIWNSIPSGNTPPDIVLGQKDFTTNNPGSGPNQLNWPVSVSVGGGKLVVADTYNNRILISNNFPTKNAQPADLIINNGSDTHDNKFKRNIIWPWGVWTNGSKLAISSTRGSLVLLWNTFPTQNDQTADTYLTANSKFGTPRTITGNGNNLIVGDHNPKVTDKQGNFFWKNWPTTDDASYDFFMSDPFDAQGAWMQGDFTNDGKLILLGAKLHIWNSFPQSALDTPNISIGQKDGAGYKFIGGDGSGLAVIGNKLFISLSNGNKIVGYNSIPTKPDALPDFAIGSPDIITNTLDTSFIISNPNPATDGKSLFVSSDFDRRLYVWKNLPNESGANPDFVYTLPEESWDNALFENNLVLAGKKSVYIWDKLPLNGEKPTKIFNNSIGSIQFNELMGVALDEKYFYLSDGSANKIYVWEKIPSQNSEPKFILNSDKPGRLSSDGNYFVVTATDASQLRVYKINELSSNSQPINIGGIGTPASTHKYNLTQGSLAYGGMLFLAGTNSNKVYIWKNIEDALNGKNEDVLLGNQSDNFDDPPQIGKNTLFWPAGLAFDGSYLWVGEFKFSERLLRYSVQ